MGLESGEGTTALLTSLSVCFGLGGPSLVGFGRAPSVPRFLSGSIQPQLSRLGPWLDLPTRQLLSLGAIQGTSHTEPAANSRWAGQGRARQGVVAMARTQYKPYKRRGPARHDFKRQLGSYETGVGHCASLESRGLDGDRDWNRHGWLPRYKQRSWHDAPGNACARLILQTLAGLWIADDRVPLGPCFP